MRPDEPWSRSADDSLPNLAGYGREDLLATRGISLCGSRAAGDVGLEFARAVGSFAAELGLPLVSGYAKGVDMAGHVACVEPGGHTIAVLAEGLGRFRLRREMSAVMDPWDDDFEPHLTVVSEFEHNAGWTVWRAMQRNALICSLGRVLVAVDPGESGGTLDAVKKAVKRDMPVVIGWSNPERSHDHLQNLLTDPTVKIATTLDDLLAGIDAALEFDKVLPGVSQPTLF